MDYLPLLLLLFLSVITGLVYWVISIYKLYRQKKTKKATISILVFGLVILTVCWEMRIIPLSMDLDFRNQTRALTGKQFWVQNDYRYEEYGVRGEGFTFEIYLFSDDIAGYFTKPDSAFFKQFPDTTFATTKWKETPVDTQLVNFVTPVYGNWSKCLQSEIVEKQLIVKQVAKEKGSYYAFRQSSGTDLYLISPKRKMLLYINHNM